MHNYDIYFDVSKENAAASGQDQQWVANQLNAENSDFHKTQEN